MPESIKGSIEKPTLKERTYTKEEIAKRLELVHGIHPEKWEKAQKIGSLLSPREMVKRGIIEKEDITNPGETLTNKDDVVLDKDRYIFLSVGETGYGWGGVHLSVDRGILNREGVQVSIAGDSIAFKKTPELRKYYLESIIPGSQFIDYLYDFVNKLPNPEWFFGKNDASLKRLRGKAISEEEVIDSLKEQEHLPKWLSVKNYKLWNALAPEIMVPDEIPLSSIKKVKKDPNYWLPNKDK